MRRVHALGIALLLSLSLIALSCGGATTGGELIGTWMSADGQERVEFTKDGKFKGQLKYGMSQSLRDIQGTYFVDEAKLSMTPTGDYPMTWDFKVSGAEVVFTYVKGGAVKMDGAMAKFKRQ